MRNLSIEEMGLQGGSAVHTACVVLMSVCGGIWTAAAGMATLGAGFVVGLGWSVFNDWVCSHAQ